ncbi:carbohydrate-binding protein [Colwelliaceae bacterium BS250]
MPDNRMNIIESRLSKLVRTALLGASIITLSGCFGVESDNEIIENAGGDVVDNTQITQPDPVVLPDELIPDLTLADITVRDRPHMDTSLGYNVILSDLNTTLRGVSLSYDGGDPYNAAQIKNVPTAEQLESLVNDYGINTLHVYLEGDAEQNPDPVGINEVIADQLVELTRDAKMYLILTVGNNGENGAIHSLEKTLDFWTLYGAKYKDETHVIYEAHNEPVSLDNPNWTADDWDKQAQMYDTIRSVAPDTLVLLGSFMSFSGASPAIAGADGLKALYPGIWDNAGFAFHGYWDLPSIEATIDAFEVSTDYPALLSTEFWPGDTQNGYNEAFENHHIGWMQFEWLNANDLDLGHIKNSLNTFGTVWRSETAEGSWPASGEPTIPFGENIGLYSRADDAFLNLDDANNVLAGDDNFDGEGSDTFVVVDAGNDGFIALRGANGKYLSVANYGLAMTASADTIGANEKFKWLELPSGDVALRPWGGSGHLIGTIPAGDGLEEGFTGSVGDGALLNGDNTYLVVTSTTSAPLAPLDTPTVPEPGAFYGEPMPVPTSGESVHPYNDKAPNGRLWAADFDFGGEAVAYHDNDALNKGDAYRFDEGVDVEAASEGYTAVGFFDNEEWMEYTIDVAEEGNYIVTLRTASAGGGHLSIESNCVDLTGSVATPDTGGWDVWQDMTVEVTLEAGIQKLRLVSGGGMNVMNMDIQSGGVGSVEFTDGCQWVPPVPADVRVEAEDWTTVIELPDGEVVVENTADADGEQNVGFIDAGDWMEYNVELPEYGCYIVDYRVASDTGSEGFTLSFDGILADTVTVPSTGGWQSWKSISSALELNAGLQTMRFEALGGQQNINWFEFTQADASECGVTTYGDNLITNHTFEDDTGWTVVSQDEGVFGEVTIAGGVVKFSETDIDEWQHMGVYTAVELSVGTYQFDMDMSYSDIVDTWGEVYIGLTQPVANAEYNGDQQVLVAYNSWGCGDATTYSGAATESGCDGNATPGRFEITTSGTYYLLLRSGGKTYGVNGAEFDNWSLREVNPEPTPEPEPETGNLITNGTFENATGWTVVSQWGLDVEGNGVVTVADGAVTFSETTSAGWSKQMGIYTAVTLPVGTYQFDMDVTYADINELWGEVYIGSTQPVANEEYSGDQQVIKAYNSWDCGVAYSGAATEAGCDTSETPGQFEITEAGTYYLLFRSGATTYGPTGVVLDNWTLTAVE